jgi:hypothetical protein
MPYVWGTDLANTLKIDGTNPETENLVYFDSSL